jgi:hypothetical protein
LKPAVLALAAALAGSVVVAAPSPIDGREATRDDLADVEP